MKKARGGNHGNQHLPKAQIGPLATNTAANLAAGVIGGSSKGQIDPCLPTNTAAKLAAEHSVLRLVEVPASASSVHATGFEQIVRHLVPKRESRPSSDGRRA